MSGEPGPRESPCPNVGAGEPPPSPLAFQVEAEAGRVPSDSRPAPDPERLAEGWERRFIADEVRVAEMVQLYNELGYQTIADPIRPADLAQDCGDCPLVAQRRLKVIYTRPGRASHGA